jgi:hypothetical protein
LFAVALYTRAAGLSIIEDAEIDSLKAESNGAVRGESALDMA